QRSPDPRAFDGQAVIRRSQFAAAHDPFYLLVTVDLVAPFDLWSPSTLVAPFAPFYLLVIVDLVAPFDLWSPGLAHPGCSVAHTATSPRPAHPTPTGEAPTRSPSHRPHLCEISTRLPSHRPFLCEISAPLPRRQRCHGRSSFASATTLRNYGALDLALAAPPRNLGDPG